MKKTKKLVTLFLTAIFALTALFAFSACAYVDDYVKGALKAVEDAQETPDAPALSGTMTVVVDAQEEGVEAKVYTVDLTKYTANDHVEKVVNDLVDAQGLYYEGYRGTYGIFYTAIGYVTKDETTGYDVTNYILQQGGGKYVTVYTSVVADADTSEYKTTVEYDGKTLTDAAVGATQMHIETGAVVYFTYFSYGV